MKYDNILPARFISRPNRFIAEIEVNGKKEICHVKNTGRCKELLVPNAKIYVQYLDSAARKTKYDLISVFKGEELINMDSQAPNKVFLEWVNAGGFLSGITKIKPECKYNSSRFDFYIEVGERKIFAEIKGVTLEENGVVMFPDAPTERGVKHIKELCDCVKNGYEAYVFFIVQMNHCKCFVPNRKTHSEFADALLTAATAGVNIRALDCVVTHDELTIDMPVEVRL